MTKKPTKGLTITPANKEILPKGNSVVVDSVPPHKSITAGRKLKPVKVSAIITTPPIIDTVNEVINFTRDVVPHVTPLVIMLLKERIEKKKKKDDVNSAPEKGIEVSGDNNNVQIQKNEYINCQFHNGNQENKE